MKRPGYREAVDWIALNDSAGDDDDAAAIAGYVTSCLVADIFGVPPDRVGADVHRARRLANVDPLEECCGTCKAVPGFPCRNPQLGREMSSPHASRLRKALTRAARGGSEA